ncbi:MAG: Flp pilus assembly complex ATPase component TadA [Phycisphaeraceae bacterium]|nr:Flp pilus assembly complex ATPase component TadA [Phycisphaeraceae bacterium]
MSVTTAEHADQPPAPGARILYGLASERFCARIPIGYARDHLVISQGVDADGAEQLVCADPGASALVAHNLAVRLGRPVTVGSGDADSIVLALDELAQRLNTHSDDSGSGGAGSRNDVSDAIGDVDEQDIEALLKIEDRDLLQTSGRAPIVKLVNGLLFHALSVGASDIHVQPLENSLVVRRRVDGELEDVRTLSRKLLEPIVGRVKVMANMDVAERRLPQDGRAVVAIGPSEVDLRVSSLPTAHGERLVIRLLDKRKSQFFHLENLGMPRALRDRFSAVCVRPHGMILVTGPTGSGKTTTLYSVLQRVASPNRNVMTIEDPIEYELPGVSQSQINLRKGVTFATGLRHILRQDPDVIMVGEIRDAETARIAIQSALTGHLVFSTLHTNSAVTAVTRLIDLGVEPYLINDSLAAALAQRLVRRKCAACDGTGAIAGEPCEGCRGRGLRGRVGLYELLVMDDRLRTLIGSGASASVLEAAARESGMQSLRDAGLDAVVAGVTTRSEIDRVTLIDDSETPAPCEPDTATNPGMPKPTGGEA